MKKWLVVVFIAVMITACNRKEAQRGNAQMNQEISDSKMDYEEISQKDAKDIMDSETECTILDVRTEPEYEAGHIEDAVLLPVDEINEKATGILQDKEALILVYCRSGVRSKRAASALVDLGYTNVKEFGGIMEWPYDIVR